MYQPNLQIIIKKLLKPANNKTSGQNVSNLTISSKLLAKSTQRLIKHVFIAACAAFTIIAIGCENPGNVGGSFLDEEANLETRTIAPGSFEGYSTDAFTGRLRYMAIGHYDDLLFGEFQSIGIIKPDIDTTAIGSSISEEDTFKLRLVFSETVYGDTMSTANFEIYRASNYWRGNELRFGQSISYDETQLVGEFSVEGTETVEVDLDRSWVEEYNEFLSSEADDRTSRYRDNFPGLVIVPADENTKVLFAKIRPASGEEDSDLEYVRFVRENGAVNGDNNGENGNEENGNGDNDNDNGDNGEEEDPRQFQRVFDWGALKDRSSPAENPEGSVIHNTLDQMAVIKPELDDNRIGSKNLANVQLILYKDRSRLDATLPDGHNRPAVTRARIHLIESGSVSDHIFSQSPDLVSELNTTDDTFRFNLTDYTNTVLFSTPRAGDFYLSVETINGLTFSTFLYDRDAPEDVRPKILITSVKSGS
jgi:hypothetical protein